MPSLKTEAESADLLPYKIVIPQIDPPMFFFIHHQNKQKITSIVGSSCQNEFDQFWYGSSSRLM